LPHVGLVRLSRGDLRGELLHVGLRLLQIEAGAGAGGGQLGVLRDALLRQFERRLKRADLLRGIAELFRQLRFLGLGIGQAGVHFVELGLLRRDPCQIRLQVGLERVQVGFVLGWINLEEDVAFLDRPIVLDRHFEHASADARHDGHDVLDDADVTRRRGADVQQQQHRRQRDDREHEDADLPRRRPRQQLELDEDEPDDEAVDAEEDDFH
jgi:hypothetical protein